LVALSYKCHEVDNITKNGLKALVEDIFHLRERDRQTDRDRDRERDREMHVQEWTIALASAI